MKIQEFTKIIEELGYKIIKAPSKMLIDYKGNILAAIDTEKQYSLEIYNIFDEGKANELFSACIELAQTPIEKREKALRYCLRRKDNYQFYENENERYLECNRVSNTFYLTSGISSKYIAYQNTFTQNEIDEIKEKYGTDLSEFEQVKVPEQESEEYELEMEKGIF